MPNSRNILAGIIIIAVLCVGILAALTFFPPSSTSLHYERSYTGTRPVYLEIAGLEDCVLTMGYEDDGDLMYRIDIELYDADETVNFEYRLGTLAHFVDMNWGDYYGATTRARTMNITLGTGLSYNIVLGGDPNSKNVTGNIVFDNNATLGSETFAYLFPGSLNLAFTENVDYSQGGLDMETGRYLYEIAAVTLYVNLPDGMDGHAVFRSESMSVSLTGWTMYKQEATPTIKYYRTSESPTKPLLDIEEVFADSIIATLAI